mmetsp:Transcript_31152/g.68696  ORF Transcript_31152/g.68696 Transcript_31152/m.68696 type:complete len:80 (+) Transcript_31152:339-578(+)
MIEPNRSLVGDTGAAVTSSRDSNSAIVECLLSPFDDCLPDFALAPYPALEPEPLEVPEPADATDAIDAEFTETRLDPAS